MKDIILIGFGGHAKSVADCIERQGRFNIIGYTDFQQHKSEYLYLGTDDCLTYLYDKGVRYAAVGVGYLGKGRIRESIYANLKKIGFELPVIVDPSAIIAKTAVIGEGSFIGKNAIINADAQVGKMVILNTSTLVEHECIVGDFSHIAVSAVLCGQVNVGKGSFIGANATVIQCMNIEPYQTVPAGLVIR